MTRFYFYALHGAFMTDSRQLPASSDTSEDWQLVQSQAVAFLNKFHDPLKKHKDILRSRGIAIDDHFGWHVGDKRRLDQIEDQTDREKRQRHLDIAYKVLSPDEYFEYTGGAQTKADVVKAAEEKENIANPPDFDKYPKTLNRRAIHFYAPSIKYLRDNIYRNAMLSQDDLKSEVIESPQLRKLLLQGSDEIKQFGFDIKRLTDNLDCRDYYSDKVGFCYTLHDESLIRDLSALAVRAKLDAPLLPVHTLEWQRQQPPVKNPIPIRIERQDHESPEKKSKWCNFFRPLFDAVFGSSTSASNSKQTGYSRGLQNK